MQNNKAADPHHPKNFVKVYMNACYNRETASVEQFMLNIKGIPNHLLKLSSVQNDIAKGISGFYGMPDVELYFSEIIEKYNLSYNENDEIEDMFIAVFKWIMRDIDPFQSAINVLDATRMAVAV